jgi:hypothetical protein
MESNAETEYWQQRTKNELRLLRVKEVHELLQIHNTVTKKDSLEVGGAEHWAIREKIRALMVMLYPKDSK